jgi:hypothetical protein
MVGYGSRLSDLSALGNWVKKNGCNLNEMAKSTKATEK